MLRTQQAQLRVDYAKLSTKFGEGYPKLAELGNEMAQVDGAISTELKNLTERYRNEYLSAANAEKMLQSKFEEQKQKAYDLNQEQHSTQSSNMKSKRRRICIRRCN